MNPPPSLKRSITISMVVYLVVQAGVYTAVLLLAGVSLAGGWGYYPVSFVFHVLVLLFLLWRARDFRRITDGSYLTRVNLPCHLTLLRLSSTPTLTALVFHRGPAAAGVALLAVVTLVFLTDFFDGRIARARGETTDVGSYLDSSSDYVILAATAGAFTVFGVLPGWYAAVLFTRLGVHAAGMGLLSLLRGAVEPETTFLGKVAVFAAMIVAAFQVARWYGIPGVGHAGLVHGIEIAGAAVLGLSLVEKLVYLARKLRRAGPS